MKWMERANCANLSSELFFSPEKQIIAQAKQVCAGCEVRGDCLEYAMKSNRGYREQIGVWAGIDFSKQSEVKRRKVAS